MSMHRRTFLCTAAVAVASRASDWQQGEVAHILPTASHERILLKVSFTRDLPGTPALRIGRRTVTGIRSDTRGRFWQFDAPNLKPGETYTLQIFDARKRSLCDSWTLRTLPEPGAALDRFRLLIYTCAGGDERLRTAANTPQFLSLAQRGRLLDRALSFAPDAAIANGDQIYWDLHQTGAANASEDILKQTGRFIRNLPVLGTQNEEVLKRVADMQIGRLYGTRFRSLPVFFVQDDHDYFENDDANERMVTFPPDHLMMQLGRVTRRMYYPEFLPDAERPAGLPGATAPDTPPGTGESFGTLRAGNLLEVLLYDCRRHLTLAGPNAVVIPREAEDWIKSRLAGSRVAHVVQVPSLPPIWSAGKWGDWYSDILDKDGKLTDKIVKPYWQPGWGAQHDRLMLAASQMNGRIPLFISGDLHALAEGRIHRTPGADLRQNPVNVLLAGPVSTAGTGWPSAGRRIQPTRSLYVEAEEKLKPVEQNGFTLVDFTPQTITARMFRWRPPQTDEAIDNLEPFHTAEFRR